MFSVQINHGNSLMVWIYYFIQKYINKCNSYNEMQSNTTDTHTAVKNLGVGRFF